MLAKREVTKKRTRAEMDAAAEACAANRPSLRRGAESDLTPNAPMDRIVTYDGLAMTMPFSLQVVADPADQGKIVATVENVLREVDEIYNNWNPDSELETVINAEHRPKVLTVSPTLRQALQKTEEVVRHTGGRFDPTIAPVLATWQSALGEKGTPPTGHELDSYKFCVGWTRNVKFLVPTPDGGCTMSLPNTLTRLDLGGVAKGLALDAMGAALVGAGFEDWIVDWGGEVKARGHHPSGRPWRICLVGPPELENLFKKWNAGQLAEVISDQDIVVQASLENMSAATSGDYFQVYKYGHHHIVHPGHQVPLKVNEEGVASATVLADSAVVADGVATAAMVASNMDSAQNFLDRLMSAGTIRGYCLLSRKHHPHLAGEMLHITEEGKVRFSVADKVARVPTLRGLQPIWDTLVEARRQAPAPWDFTVSINGGLEVYTVNTVTTASIKPLMLTVIAPAQGVVPIPGDEVTLATTNTPTRGKIEGTVSAVHATPGDGRVFCVTVRHVAGNLDGPTADENLKALMRRQIVPLTLVTFTALDGRQLAFTASSVRALAPGAFVFNVQVNSMAGLAVTGCTGSRVGIHFLGGAAKELAAYHVKETEMVSSRVREMTGHPLTTTEDGVPMVNAQASALCRVVRSFTAGDHVVVIAALEEVVVAPNAQHQRALLYRDREFVEHTYANE